MTVVAAMSVMIATEPRRSGAGAIAAFMFCKFCLITQEKISMKSCVRKSYGL